MRVIGLVCFMSFLGAAFADTFDANILLFPSSIVQSDKSTAGDGQFVLRLRGVIYEYEEDRSEVDYSDGGQVTFNPVWAIKKATSKIFVDRTRQFFTETPENREFNLLVSISPEQTLKTKDGNDAAFGEIVVTAATDSDANFINVPVVIDEYGGFLVDIPTTIGNDGNLLPDQLAIPIDNVDTSTGNSPLYWVQARLESTVDSQFYMTTEVQVNIIGLQNNELQIISDVDDTVKISNVNQGVMAMLKTGLFEPFRPVPYMSDLFKHIVDERASAQVGKTGLHFLSASPWPLLTSYINDFFITNDFPWASATSRVEFPRGLDEVAKMAFKDDDTDSSSENDNMDDEQKDETYMPDKRGGPISESLEEEIKERTMAYAFKFKQGRMDEMIRGPSWKHIIFFGDSTESDAEAARYMAGVHRFVDHGKGGNVVCIFLRFVAKDADKQEEEYQHYLERVKYQYDSKALSDRPLEHVRVFRDATELLDVDFTKGECHSEESLAVWDTVTPA